MLCSLAPYPGTPKTAAQTGVSLSLAAFCCRWNTVTPRPPLIFCGSFFNIPFPLLFCSSYSCCHLFLQVLESKFGKGVFPHHLSTSCPLPSSLLLALLRFQHDKPAFPGSRRESPASLGVLGREWRRLPPRDTLSSLPPAPSSFPGWRGSGAEGISGEGGNHLAFQPRLRVSVDQEARKDPEALAKPRKPRRPASFIQEKAH